MTPTKRTLMPTFIGRVMDLEDAVIVVEGCLSGVYRSWNAGEQPDCICSGDVFVYSESSTGAGDWKFGKDWQVVRQEDGFLIQREHSNIDTLWKKSRSIVVGDLSHHIVSYFKISDTEDIYSEEMGFQSPILMRPCEDARLRNLVLREELKSVLTGSSMAKAGERRPMLKQSVL